MSDNYITHAGIKGQKWGIRRFQNEDGTLTPEGKARYNKGTEKPKKEKPESATWKSKDAKHLSDAELNRRNSRLQREQQYKQMTKSKTRKAAEWVGKTAGAVLVATAIGVLKGKMNQVYRQKLDTFEKNFMKIKIKNLDDY